jgi:RNA-directed DNA polymerase
MHAHMEIGKQWTRPWWNAGASHMNVAYPKRFFDALWLVSLLGTQRRFQHV